MVAVSGLAVPGEDPGKEWQEKAVRALHPGTTPHRQCVTVSAENGNVSLTW